MKKFLLLMLFMLVGVSLSAQDGEITGKVIDGETGEPVMFANVYVNVDGLPRGTQTDIDGFYTLKPIPPGTYDLIVSNLEYGEKKLTGIPVTSDRTAQVDVEMNINAILLGEAEVKAYKVPLIRIDDGSGATVTSKDIATMSTRDIGSIASTSAGVYQEDEGSGLNMRGTRESGTDYYIDGVRVRGNNALPATAIEQMTIVTGGIPAKYGDAVGGIVNITTKGARSTFNGGMEVITSQFLSADEYNFITASLSGPLLKLRQKGADESAPKRSVMGFFIAAEFQTEKDDDLSAIQLYKVKDEVREQLINQPLVASENSSGFVKAIDFVTEDDFREIKARENVRRYATNVSGNVTISPTSNIDIRMGGNVSYSTGGLSSQGAGSKDFYRRYELFNDEHNRRVTDAAYRGYLKFTQRFGSRFTTEEEARENGVKPSAFSNAFYSIQLDYSKSQFLGEDPVHRDNLFDYGYVGKFNTRRESSYSGAFQELAATDENGDPIGFDVSVAGVTYQGESDAEVIFEPGTQNPIAAQHTNYYYELADGDASFYNTLDQIVAGNGLINGSRPFSLTAAHSMAYLPGTVNSFRFATDNDQYRINFNASFDIKRPGASKLNKHAIEFGGLYEQRVDRYYEINAEQLWDRVRFATSKQGTAEDIRLDLANPYLIIDGERVSIYDYDEGVHGVFDGNDTIDYDYIRVTDGTFFDQQLRAKLGVGSTDHVDFFGLTPDDLSLDMFSPEDLFGSGGGDNIVNYYGYDHRGNRLTSQPSFEDFFERDENGFLKGEIGAYRPIYIAGYLQDKFTFRDLVFNIGVRVDRFDANQKVRKDKYSLYAVNKAGDEVVTSQFGNSPESIGDDYVVYVDDPLAPTRVTGYRNGDDWYNSNGEFVLDPDILANGGNVTPFISDASPAGSDIKSEDFNINSAFEDYKPALSVMPRLALSFKMTENSSFFAHYNVLTQRPAGRNFVTPDEYYYFDERAILGAFNNANLKPEKTISYELGFRQALNQSSAITLSTFYKEMRDMVQIVQVNYAYPRTYTTYDNVDFGTVKGFEIGYDLRRTKNIRLTANYTLQFADGTGSSDRAQVNLVGANQPNLRTLSPLSFDARHSINIVLDYRYGEGSEYDGPVVGNFKLLENTGANLRVTGRSGTPYTRQDIATPEQLIGVAGRSSLEGSINGSRLPASLRLDLRVDRNIKFGKDKNAKYLNVYLLIQNLLDTRNVTSVYSFTGSPDDDGFLNAPDASAFSDTEVLLYNLRQQNPNNITLPRRARVGVSFNF